MVKVTYLFVAIATVILFMVGQSEVSIAGGGVTGESVTGEATMQPFGISIYVTSGEPSLSILNPKTYIYVKNSSLLLYYSTSGEQAVWYNLDNSENITLNSNESYFNTVEGFHTLYVFANNSEGITVSKNVSFTVNLTKFIINYTKFKNNGNSTDFDYYAYEELQNLSNIVLENNSYGKIEYTGSINVTDIGGNYLDLNQYADAIFNRIGIDSNSINNFNRSAKLYFYNLVFTTPRLLIDGAVCPSSICKNMNYSPGTLSVDVEHFSYFSAEETPQTPTTPGSTGGSSSGGNGGGKEIIVEYLDIGAENILTDKNNIHVNLKQGETKLDYVKIKNNRSTAVNINININNLGDIVIPRETNITLNPWEEKIIYFDFIAREDKEPGLYMGAITFSSSSFFKEVFVAVDVNPKKSLFDVSVVIPDEYKTIKAGEKVLSEIKIYNFGDMGRVDAVIEYKVSDKNGNVIQVSNETLAVDTQINFVRRFLIPDGAKPGDYLIHVSAFYKGERASSSAWFSVVEAKSYSTQVFIAILIIILLIFLIYLLRRARRKKRVRDFLSSPTNRSKIEVPVKRYKTGIPMVRSKIEVPVKRINRRS